jgi:integrase
MPLSKGASVFYRSSKKRWILSYADPLRGQPQKVLPREITRQRDAEAWALDWLRSQDLRPDVTLTQRRDEGLLVAVCAEKWLHLRERDERVAPATLKGNREQLNGWILPRFGTTPIASLDVPSLRAFIRDIRGQRSTSRVRNIYSTFCTFYADAMAEGWVKSEANLLEHPGVRREVPKAEHARDAVCVPIDCAAALINSPIIVLEWRARYAVAFTSGCRDGEIAGMRWRDTDLDGIPATFRIEQAIALVGKKGKGAFAQPKDPKTKQSKRTMPLHPAARAALLEWRAQWRTLVGREPTADDLVFPGPNGQPTRPRSAEQIREALARLGLPTELRGRPVDFKATRSSFASWLADAGVPDQVRKRLMGHTLRDVTEKHYTARDLDQLAQAVATIPLRWGEPVEPTSPEPEAAQPSTTSASDASLPPALMTESGTRPAPKRHQFRKPLATQKPLSDRDLRAPDALKNDIQAQAVLERARIPKPLVVSSTLAGGAAFSE